MLIQKLPDPFKRVGIAAALEIIHVYTKEELLALVGLAKSGRCPIHTLLAMF